MEKQLVWDGKLIEKAVIETDSKASRFLKGRSGVNLFFQLLIHQLKQSLYTLLHLSFLCWLQLVNFISLTIVFNFTGTSFR